MYKHYSSSLIISITLCAKFSIIMIICYTCCCKLIASADMYVLTVYSQ